MLDPGNEVDIPDVPPFPNDEPRKLLVSVGLALFELRDNDGLVIVARVELATNTVVLD